MAVEQQAEITFSDGSSIFVICTPSHMEEMILAKKYLAGNLDTGELKVYPECMKSAGILEMVDLQEVFTIARDSFENPGELFAETGCAHACALIYQGKVVCRIEDIGRHNALDKVIGYAIRHQIPLRECYVFTSGRISGDYLRKVIDAGLPMVVSRAAVTDRAVKLAKESDITMLGFVRKNTGNLYHEGTVRLCRALYLPDKEHDEAKSCSVEKAELKNRKIRRRKD